MKAAAAVLVFKMEPGARGARAVQPQAPGRAPGTKRREATVVSPGESRPQCLGEGPGPHPVPPTIP